MSTDQAQVISGPVDAERPFIGDFCFDVTHGMTVENATEMAEGGFVFLTRFHARTQTGRIEEFGGSLIAKDWPAAEAEAAQRGLGETIEGTLVSVTEANP